MVRVFVGVFLPEEFKEQIVTTQNKLLNLPIECKLVERENLHISLDFIGEANEERLEQIKGGISELFQAQRAFEVEIGNMRLIPSEKVPRVIALEVHSTELENLGVKLKKKIGGDVKPPHLTLCRIKKILSRDELLKKFDGLKNEKIYFKVSFIQLIKSELLPKGPAYSAVAEFSLS